MFKKNTAVTGFPFGLVSSSDGSDITTGTPVGYFLLDGGTQTPIADVSPVHEGNGQWTFDLLAAEMNGDIVGLIFTHTNAITTYFTIRTTTKLVSELNDIAAGALMGLANGAITAAKFAAGAVDAVALATDAVDEIVDGVWNRTMAGHVTADTAGLVMNEWQDAGRLDALLDSIKAETALIVADTDELQGDWLDGGRLDLILDIIAADTTTDIPALIAALENVSQANVLTQVNAALDTNIAELAVASPTATPTIRTGIMLSYMALRNKRMSDADQDDIHNNAGAVIASAVLSDDTLEFIKAKFI